MYHIRPERHNSTGILSIPISVAVVAFLLAAALLSTGAERTSAQTTSFRLNTVVAATTVLNMRDQPAIDGKVLSAIPLNGQAVVLGGPFNDFWFWLDYQGTRGYVSGRYLAVVDENYTPVATFTVTATGTPATATATAAASPSAPSPVATTGPGQQRSATPSASTTPDFTAPTTPGDYTGLWLGQMAVSGNVRSGPGLNYSVIKGWWAGRRVLLYQAIPDSRGAIWYRVSEPPEAPMYVHSSLISRVAPVKFEPARFRGRWVNVNLTQQVVTAYQDGKPVMVTLGSTGKGKNPTDLGIWKIYWRLPKQTMEGGNLASSDYYKLPDVPFVQYFNATGESLHGTYWHDNFGTPMSHGCVNLSTPIAGWFYGWASIGTIVYVHN